MEKALDNVSSKWFNICGDRIEVFKNKLKQDLYKMNNPPVFSFCTKSKTNSIQITSSPNTTYKIKITKIISPDVGVFYLTVENAYNITSPSYGAEISEVLALQKGLNECNSEFLLLPKASINNALVLNFTLKKYSVDATGKETAISTWPEVIPTYLVKIYEITT